jgi:hypothetical protein
MKPTVNYQNPSFIEVGMRAYVYAIEHPGNAIMNSGTKEINTSTVLSYDKSTGIFETRNTIYKPI